MFRRLRDRLYNKIEEDPKFKVKYLGKLTKLILTDEYLKIGTLKYNYRIIYRFGFDKNIFYFIIKENSKEIEVSIVCTKSKEIHNELYQKCLDLVEFQEPIIDINSLPDPPTYKAYY